MIPDQRPEPGQRSALVLTVLMHVVLVAVLFLGVQWKRSQPESVEVELVSSRPAPPPPARPPPPEPKPEPKADPFKEMLEREKREQLQRDLTAQARRETEMKAAAEAEQRTAASRRGLADWVSKITGKIRGNMVLPQGIQGNPQAEFSLTLLPSGEVMQPVRLKKSSGNPALDAAIERAILKSSPLPKPDDPAVFQRMLEIKYKPYEE